MDVLQAIHERKSIRQFRPDPVPRDLLQDILQAALRAPSAINTQPWECWVVGGEPLRRMSREMYTEAEKESPSRADFVLPERWKEPYLGRMRENGKRLFGILGIERQDKEKRQAFGLSMYRFFGAPQAIFLCMDSSLGDYSLFDCGCFAQNICLLALSRRLGTCIQHSAVNYPDIIRKHAPIPAAKKIIAAISIGYPDEDAAVNRFRSSREPVENVVHWQLG